MSLKFKDLKVGDFVQFYGGLRDPNGNVGKAVYMHGTKATFEMVVQNTKHALPIGARWDMFASSYEHEARVKLPTTRSGKISLNTGE